MIFRTSKRVFAHVDCNSFYASCEVLRDPSLRGKPVCVGTEIVIAASYEAKRKGVKTGMPTWQVMRLLRGEAIIKKPDHAFYSDISGRFMRTLKERFGKIEAFSIDELFAEVTGMADDYGAFAEEIRRTIRQEIGLRVSVGISNTRIRAKMFGDLHKPDGQFVSFDTPEIERVFGGLGIREVPFIGAASENRLGTGIRTVLDFYRMHPRRVSEILGKPGVGLWLELRGIDAWTPQDTEKQRQSIVCSRSFNDAITDNPNTLWRELIANFERAYETLLSEKQATLAVGAILRTKDLRRYAVPVALAEHTIDRNVLLESLRTSFLAGLEKGVQYRTTGVTFTGLIPYSPKQLSVFDMEDRWNEKTERLAKAIHSLKGRFGDGTVRQWFIRATPPPSLPVLFEVG